MCSWGNGFGDDQIVREKKFQRFCSSCKRFVGKFEKNVVGLPRLAFGNNNNKIS